MAAIAIGLSWWTFVGGQVIAGAKLVSGTIGLSVTATIIIAGAIILIYTAMGGLKGVITLDVYQLVILTFGVIVVLVPLESSPRTAVNSDPVTYSPLQPLVETC